MISLCEHYSKWHCFLFSIIMVHMQAHSSLLSGSVDHSLAEVNSSLNWLLKLHTLILTLQFNSIQVFNALILITNFQSK